MGTALDNGIKPYNHYGAYLKGKYNGQKVFKVIVDGNFTCPNRDGSKGYGGCTYCNVDSFTPDTARKIPSIREQVENGIETVQARDLYKQVDFAFQSLPLVALYVIAMAALAFHLIHGFQSAFQTVGFNHKRYIGCIRTIGVWLFGVIIPVLFALMPLYFFFKG